MKGLAVAFNIQRRWVGQEQQGREEGQGQENCMVPFINGTVANLFTNPHELLCVQELVASILNLQGTYLPMPHPPPPPICHTHLMHCSMSYTIPFLPKCMQELAQLVDKILDLQEALSRGSGAAVPHLRHTALLRPDSYSYAL